MDTLHIVLHHCSMHKVHLVVDIDRKFGNRIRRIRDCRFRYDTTSIPVFHGPSGHAGHTLRWTGGRVPIPRLTWYMLEVRLYCPLQLHRRYWVVELLVLRVHDLDRI